MICALVIVVIYNKIIFLQFNKNSHASLILLFLVIFIESAVSSTFDWGVSFVVLIHPLFLEISHPSQLVLFLNPLSYHTIDQLLLALSHTHNHIHHHTSLLFLEDKDISYIFFWSSISNSFCISTIHQIRQYLNRYSTSNTHVLFSLEIIQKMIIYSITGHIAIATFTRSEL